MSTVVDLETLGTSGFAVQGDGAGHQAGFSVSDAGDVNGDGYDDIIVGAIGDQAGGYSAGAAYVIYGGPNGFGLIDLPNVQPGEGFKIQGDDNADLAGFSVSGAGDVNGDGFDDILVGAGTYGYYGAFSKAYLVFGKASSPATIDLSSLASSDGFIMIGEYVRYASLGIFSVAGAGDINGDGFDDIIIGAPYDNYSAGPFYGQVAGAAYVIFGKAGMTGSIDLTNLSQSVGFELTGTPGSNDFAGASVSGAGDINGDGFDDIIIGVRYGNNGGPYAGEAYVIFGKASGFGTIDLSNLAAGAGFVIQGDQAYDNAGFSVSGAGDFNGDGFDDLIVSAAAADNNHELAGEAYVIFGKASGFGTIDLSNLTPATGFAIFGDDTADHAGWSVSAAGDVNNDGLDDIIIGAPQNDQTRDGTRVIDAGEAYVIFGRVGAFGTIDLTNLPSEAGFILQGEAAYDQAGWSVSAAGDVNGDGFADIMIGAPFADHGGTDSGQAYIIFGSPNANSLAARSDFNGDFNGDGRDDVLFRHANGSFMDWLGQANGGFVNNHSNAGFLNGSWILVGTGDFNGDGRDDILWRQDDGLIMNWLGQANDTFVNNHSNAGFLNSNWELLGTGDFNGDGRDDLVLRHDNGTVMDWLGQENGSFVDNYSNAGWLNGSWQFAGTGDFNGDGRDDILWRNQNGLIMDWLGQANDTFASNFSNARWLDSSWNLLGTGDFNGDGYDDILWRHDSGLIMDSLGQANGGFTDNHANAGFLNSNWHLLGTGDFNGDGRDDLVLRHDNGTVMDWLGQENGGFTDNYANAGWLNASWQFGGTSDYDGDGRDDILWHHANGTVMDWLGQEDGGFTDNYANAGWLDNSWHIQAEALLV